MDFVTAIKTVFSKYATFTGRARRSEFWYWYLFSVILNLLTCWMPGINMLVSLAILLPTLAVAIRRLHDTNRSGWWLLLSIVPSLVAMCVLVSIVGAAIVSIASGASDVDPESMAILFASNIGLMVLYLLCILLAFVGAIILIVWWASDSQPGDNQYGPNPKAVSSDNNPTMPDIPEVPKN